MTDVCIFCKKTLTPQEYVTYRNRCENCWVYPDNGQHLSAAYCYSNKRVGKRGPRTDGKVVHKDNHL